MIESETLTGLEIAVIGMAGKFPGAGNINEFWENIKNGVESICFFSGEELEKVGIPAEIYNLPDYVKTNRGIIERLEYFDADFFGYTPLEAELLDPQLRLFHECCWEALEDAGCDPESYGGVIGLFGGAEENTDWKKKVLLSNTEAESEYTRLLLSNKDFVSARVSYKLNLKGPVYAVITGCSTALTSIHLACRTLLGGECDMALAGGVYLNTVSTIGYRYREGMLQSHDGHLRAFDSRASGTVFSSGLGVVVLKTFEDALADNDYIYAVVKGSAVNCDGNRKVNFTAPSLKGQEEVIKAAYRAADVAPETIGYLETHGTGTPLGDPIEINALNQAFNTNSGWRCPIGSVKSNIGHLDTAAGVIGFIKTVLVLKHKQIPPSLHFETPNPKLELEKTPFYVNTRLKEWESNGSPRRAAVSSFGFGGTNVHVVLEEAPEPEPSSVGRKFPIIMLSAKTRTALDAATRKLAEFLKRNPGMNLADVAYTLQPGRQPFRYRRMCVGSNVDEVVQALASSREGISNEDPHVVFMFSGQGSQYVNMGLEIYHSESIFREEMDHGFDILKSLTGKDFKDIVYPPRDTNDTQERINDVLYSGPIKFIFEYSLAKLLIHWGIRPHALMGHSFGEYAAACLAGIFSTRDALKLALLRGELMLRTPPGGMMSIPLPEDQLNLYLQSHPDISLAAVNSSYLCFVSGPHESLDHLEKELQEKGIECIPINFPRAAHSHMMKTITGEFADQVKKIKLQEPTIPFISGLTGDWLSPGEITNPNYWAKHLENPVRFYQGVEKLISESHYIYIQVGSDKGLPLFVNRNRDLKPGTLVINMVKHKKDNVSDIYYLSHQLGMLWLHGVRIDWPAFYAHEQRHKIPLPTYPFEGRRYWLDLDHKAILSRFSLQARLGKRKNVSDWLYTSSWKRCPPVQEASGDKYENIPGLIFSDTCELGLSLRKKLEEKGQEVIIVKPGEMFEKENRQVYRINPTRASDYNRLFKALKAQKKIPGIMIHLWNVTGKKDSELTCTSLERTLDLGFYSLIHIVQSMGKLNIDKDVRLVVITDNMQQVVGEEFLCPAKAAVLGAVRVIPQEYRNISCLSLDIILPEPGTLQEEQLLRQLPVAFTHKSFNKGNPVAAFRGNHFWTQVFEPAPVEKPRPVSSRLKQGGVYLVTGGLGGIGLVLAEYLVKTVKAKLVLTGRSRLPAKDRWQQWLDTHRDQDPVSRKIKKVMDLEKQGGEVMVFSADAADQDRMQEVMNRALAHFGQVNGIIHSAGLVDEYGVIRNRTREMTENILAPKVKGTLILHHLTRDMTLDFFVICSSMASLFPQFGEVGYAAANIFIDAFASYKASLDSTFTVSINWDTWQEVGAAVDTFKRKKAAGKTTRIRLKDTILSAEGAEAFALILDNTNPQVVVSTKDLELILQHKYSSREEEKTAARENKKIKSTNSKKTLGPRPNLSTAYAAPRNLAQQTLAQIWQMFLGIDTIGIHDDFFELGGDSLMAAVMATRVHKRMNIRVPLTQIFQGPTIEQLCRYMKRREKEEFESILPVEKKEYYPLSSAQKRLFFLERLENIGTSYNIPQVFITRSKPEIEKYEKVFKALIIRHQSLRTSFLRQDDEPVQKIHDQVDFKIEYYEPGSTLVEVKEKEGTRGLAPLPEEARLSSSDVGRHLSSGFIRPFNLSKAPLIRAGIAALGKEEYLLLFDMHHIIGDGTSMGILVDDFIRLYEHEMPPPLKIQYKDFSQWQNNLFESGKIKAQEDYWLGIYGDNREIPRLKLPTDYPPADTFRFEGDRYEFMLGIDNCSGLRQMAARYGATIFMTLMAGLNVLLYKYTGQKDMIVGTGIMGRPHADLEKIIGMFVNSLAIRNYPEPGKTFREFLKEVKDNCIQAFENQDLQFEALVDKLKLERVISKNPLFNVLLMVQNYLRSGVVSKNLEFIPYKRPHTTSKFDITISAYEGKNEIAFAMEYSTNLFKPSTIRQMAAHYIEILKQAMENPHCKLKDFHISHQLEAVEVDKIKAYENDFDF